MYIGAGRSWGRMVARRGVFQSQSAGARPGLDPKPKADVWLKLALLCAAIYCLPACTLFVGARERYYWNKVHMLTEGKAGPGRGYEFPGEPKSEDEMFVEQDCNRRQAVDVEKQARAALSEDETGLAKAYYFCAFIGYWQSGNGPGLLRVLAAVGHIDWVARDIAKAEASFAGARILEAKYPVRRYPADYGSPPEPARPSFWRCLRGAAGCD